MICIGSVRNFVLRFRVRGGDVSIRETERGGDADIYNKESCINFIFV